MTETETAVTLGLSERTVRRDWREARGWLAERVAAT
jgi:DNA-binding CsgD family transcriptional regulator